MFWWRNARARALRSESLPQKKRLKNAHPLRAKRRGLLGEQTCSHNRPIFLPARTTIARALPWIGGTLPRSM